MYLFSCVFFTRTFLFEASARMFLLVYRRVFMRCVFFFLFFSYAPVKRLRIVVFTYKSFIASVRASLPRKSGQFLFCFFFSFSEQAGRSFFYCTLCRSLSKKIYESWNSQTFLTEESYKIFHESLKSPKHWEKK